MAENNTGVGDKEEEEEEESSPDSWSLGWDKQVSIISLTEIFDEMAPSLSAEAGGVKVHIYPTRHLSRADTIELLKNHNMDPNSVLPGIWTFYLGGVIHMDLKSPKQKTIESLLIRGLDASGGMNQERRGGKKSEERWEAGGRRHGEMRPSRSGLRKYSKANLLRTDMPAGAVVGIIQDELRKNDRIPKTSVAALEDGVTSFVMKILADGIPISTNMINAIANSFIGGFVIGHREGLMDGSQGFATTLSSLMGIRNTKLKQLTQASSRIQEVEESDESLLEAFN